MLHSIWSLLPDQLHFFFADHQEQLSKITVDSLVDDSRQVTPTSLFLAVPGTESDGRDFIAQAQAQHVSFIVAQSTTLTHAFDETNSILWIADLNKWVGHIAAAFYHWPCKDIKLVGVTGTNGKTTVTHMLVSLLQQSGVKSAVMGTNGYGAIGDLQPQSLTTPGALMLQKQLAELRDQNFTFVAMEVSSHALVQHRVSGCQFHGVILTNVARDHLDYHKSIDEYVAAKSLLFSQPKTAIAVINNNDQYAQFFKDCTTAQLICTYAQSTQDIADVCIEVIQLGVDSQLQVRLKSAKPALQAAGHEGKHYDTFKFYTSLIGEFNYDNLLACICFFLCDGHTSDEIKTWLDGLILPEGRMQVVLPSSTDKSQINTMIKGSLSPYVVVDYAHTPDAIALVLQTLKKLARERCGELIAVFGCGGDRDRGKRPLMAAAAETHADVLYITADNPRFECQQQIFEDIKIGLPDVGQVATSPVRNITFEHHRERAINAAIANAQPQDVVAILGKGHETYQEVNGVRSHFDDRLFAGKALSRLQAIDT